MHKCVADGPSSGDVPEIYTLLLNAMQNYKFAIVGTTSYDEYRLTIAKKTRFNNKLTIGRIEEPNMELTLEIMKGEADKLCKHYDKEYDTTILQRIYDLSRQYIREKKFPAKGITVLNQVFAHAYIENTKTVDVKADAVIFERDYKEPSAMSKRDVLDGLKVIADKVKQEVIGQDEAINTLMRYWRIKQYGLTRPNKPIASLLFTGNTGTGKTHLAKQFADTIGYKLIRFDMSEYKEGHTISKLIGSPAGYVGHEEGGLLVNAVKSNPNCVLLLDEIEKAHRDIYNLLLQIMDNAELTSAQGEKVDFQNAVIIMTSNCGASEADKAKGIGFGVSEADNSKTQQKIITEAINRTFTPEFRGRLNAIVQFNPMSEHMCKEITDKKLSDLTKLLLKTRSNFNVTYTQELKDYIIKTAMSSKAGGRSVEKSIDEVTDALLDMSRLDNLDVEVNYTNNKIVLNETMR
jgi:ATP-dependent Clp protease ATP-binding subunit ClpA